jgi:hypothetical protein
MVANTDERQLWWRHLMSILVFPVTMTLVIPALIVMAADVRMPDLGSPAAIGLVTIGGLLIAGGLGLMICTVTLFDRVGKGTLGVGTVMGEPVHLVVRGPYRVRLAAGMVRDLLDVPADRHPVLGRAPPGEALRQRIRGLPAQRSKVDSSNLGLGAKPITHWHAVHPVSAR